MSLASALSLSGSAFMKEPPGTGAADPTAAGLDASLLSPLLSPSRSCSLAPPTPALAAADDESRAYKLALELSLVGLDERAARPPPPQQPEYNFDALRAISAAVAAVAQTQGGPKEGAGMRRNGFAELAQGGGELVQLVGAEDRTKKSQNMTECVPVPSSEHVAEIVGRQGCKIKALRTKTNTYIKTPVRGEEPVFVVTGRKEDVAKAKREIISAAEHFSFIRASRRPFADASSASSSEVNSFVSAGSGSGNGSGSRKGPTNGPPLPGQITIKVRVPYRVVGLVVGPKGATIKHIQQETQTYIITPSRDKEPVFEVTGLPDNVQAARKQIESHIALRTGNLQDEPLGLPAASTPAAPNVYTISQIFSEEINPDFLASLYKNGMFDYVEPDNGAGPPLNGLRAEADFRQAGPGAGAAYLPPLGASHFAGKAQMAPLAGLPAESADPSPGLLRSCSSASSTASSKSTNGSNASRPELLRIWKSGAADAADVDEGLGESPNIWTAAAMVAPNCSPSASISPTDSLLGEIGSAYGFARAVPHAAPHDAGLGGKAPELARRECLICNNKSVTAALVPCGHNMFCMECANTICCSADATCPVCNSPVYQAMRIFS